MARLRPLYGSFPVGDHSSDPRKQPTLCHGYMHAKKGCDTSPTAVQRSDAAALGAAGFIKLPGSKSQNYTFSMTSDDDSLLFIDGKEVISDTGVGRVFTCDVQF